MIKEVVLYPSEILSKMCKEAPLDNSTKEICQHLNDTLMTTTGIGLAAPQIGIDQKIFLIDVQGFKEFCINPKILNFTQKEYKIKEGCLSLPGKQFYVSRPSIIEVEYYDESFILKRQILGSDRSVFDDFRSTVFQHEFDHLFGQLINKRHKKNPKELQA